MTPEMSRITTSDGISPVFIGSASIPAPTGYPLQEALCRTFFRVESFHSSAMALYFCNP